MSSSEPRSTAVPKYFTNKVVKESTAKGIVAIVVGSIMIPIGLIIMLIYEDYSGGIACLGVPGVILIITGIIILTKVNARYKKEIERTEPKPSEAQMDAWLEEDKARIIQPSIFMSKLDLPAESVINANDPLVVIGPAAGAKIKAGEDGVFRFSRYEIVVIYLTDYHLGAYSCELDFVTGNVTREQTQEYHYTDVVSVATLTSNTPFRVETMDGTLHPIVSSQEFSLSVASGQSIRVAVNFPQLPDILKTGRLAPTGAERAISTLRTLLREKKSGLAHV